MAAPAVSSLAARRRPRTRLDLAWLAGCILGFVALCWLLHAFVADDAWITERYARNLADGLGFTWNPAGAPVEGFSNPLLVAGEALARGIGLGALDTARWLGVGCGVALVVVLHRLGPAIVGRPATRVAMGLTALYPPLALWAVGGLETLPMTLATTAGLLLAIGARDRRGTTAAGLVLALLPWLRPEGIVIAGAIAIGAQAPGLLARAGRREALWRTGLAVGIPVASQAVLEAVRLAAYGHLLPNSVLYKAGTGGALDVLGRFALTTAPLLAFAAAGLTVARGRQRILIVVPAVYAVGSLGMLDSVNAFNRFLLPTWPALALLAGLGVTTAARDRRLLRITAVAGAVAALGLVGVNLVNTTSFAQRYASCRQQPRAKAAAWLQSHTGPHARFSISDAGLVPAHAGSRTAMDHFLLNSPAIQRTGALPVGRRVDFILRRKPDVVFMVSTSPTRFHSPYATDAALRRDPRFRDYRLAYVARGDGRSCGYDLFAYQRG